MPRSNRWARQGAIGDRRLARWGHGGEYQSYDGDLAARTSP